jgi:hypothetical protein
MDAVALVGVPTVKILVVSAGATRAVEAAIVTAAMLGEAAMATATVRDPALAV